MTIITTTRTIATCLASSALIRSGTPPNRDMFRMDYVDDDAMHLFTVGQVARMHATLDGPRKGIEAGAKRSRRAR
jgi:hypothetical protein